MTPGLPQKIIDQMVKAGLPINGEYSFRPKLITNYRGQRMIAKRSVLRGPKKGKKGYVDEDGHIWIKDHAHGGMPDHWDVQIDDGDGYIRVNLDGNILK